MAFVVSENLTRRHLSAGQLAALAVEIKPALAAEAKERMKDGGKSAGKGRPKQGRQRIAYPIPDEPQQPEGDDNSPTEIEPAEEPNPPKKSRDEGKATEQAAKTVGTNRQYVSDAEKIKEHSTELFAKVKAGEITISQAKKQNRPSNRLPGRFDLHAAKA